ncbi:ribosomal protein L17 [Tieghemostelium lacteum]|uniref:Ribosomal protein L17 n=1 Tax=Tieghemostelium lacteum TaxID=361077 RepID=A0A151ZF33_TIELA|nr:ribosomal protein L17 [Tieghemostelium lacteum]|eukprot:KYQ92582.1 ribosomal protein L17 [Tieghemostelium lacteum]
MRHGDVHRKLGRLSQHRMLMFRTMVTQLIKHERIKTTLPKAKELIKEADKIITIAKRNTRQSHSLAFAYLTDRSVIPKLFKQLRLRFKDRHGGYCRILKVGNRLSDKAPMAYIEYVDNDLKPLRDYRANNAKHHMVKKNTEEGVVFSYQEKESGKVLSSAMALNNRFKKLSLSYQKPQEA